LFKNRAMMSGIGIGLIAGAILLQVMLAAKGAGTAPSALAGKTPPDEMDPKQLKEAAAKYYQVFEKNEKVYTQAEVDKKVQEALNAQRNQAAAAAPAAEKKVAVYISPGLIASQVAELLYRSGVVTDRNAFEKLLNEQQITSKIQVGYHVFEGTPEPQQVINALLAAQ
jgi:hypothetical protein